MGYPSGRDAAGSPTFDKANPWFAPTELNFDAFLGYERKRWDGRIDWKVQLNAKNIFERRDLIPIAVQPWGQTAAVRLSPEERWYLTNTFSF